MPYIRLTDAEAATMREMFPDYRTRVVDTPQNQLLDAVLTISEAADLWQLDGSTIRHAIRQGRLQDGIDCRKSERGPWLIARAAMLRVFGTPGGVKNEEEV